VRASRPILQIDMSDRTWKQYFCSMCGDFCFFRDDGILECQDCHKQYSKYTVAQAEQEFVGKKND